jgi:hypothetical protein
MLVSPRGRCWDCRHVLGSTINRYLQTVKYNDPSCLVTGFLQGCPAMAAYGSTINGYLQTVKYNVPSYLIIGFLQGCPALAAFV